MRSLALRHRCLTPTDGVFVFLQYHVCCTGIRRVLYCAESGTEALSPYNTRLCGPHAETVAIGRRVSADPPVAAYAVSGTDLAYATLYQTKKLIPEFLSERCPPVRVVRVHAYAVPNTDLADSLVASYAMFGIRSRVPYDGKGADNGTLSPREIGAEVLTTVFGAADIESGFTAVRSILWAMFY
eukprot:23752-Rhodomonas_salina.1